MNLHMLTYGTGRGAKSPMLKMQRTRWPRRGDFLCRTNFRGGVSEGSVENPKPNVAFAIHTATFPANTLGYCSGDTMAASELVKIEVHGSGSPPAVSFENVAFDPTAALTIEIEGTAPGTEHDQLIAGTVQIAGSLNLQPIDGYVSPVVRGQSDDFVLVLAGSRANHFSNVTYDGAALSADFGPDGSGSFRDHVAGGLFRSVTYTAATVQLQNLLALAGDTDGDADVDLSDYNRLATHFDPVGSLGPHGWSDGNFDGDGDIDLADYNALAGNFAAGGYGTAAVPEPASVCLLLLVSVSGRLSKHRCGKHV